MELHAGRGWWPLGGPRPLRRHTTEREPKHAGRAAKRAAPKAMAGGATEAAADEITALGDQMVGRQAPEAMFKGGGGRGSRAEGTRIARGWGCTSGKGERCRALGVRAWWRRVVNAMMGSDVGGIRWCCRRRSGVASVG